MLIIYSGGKEKRATLIKNSGHSKTTQNKTAKLMCLGQNKFFNSKIKEAKHYINFSFNDFEAF